MNFVSKALILYSLISQFSFISSSINSFSKYSYPNSYKVGDDNFQVPEWLQNISPENKVSKYRRRRFITSSSTLKVTPKLTFPSTNVKGISMSSTAQSSLTFAIPSELSLSGRSLQQIMNRTHFFDEVQSFFDGLGYHGRSCLLKTICELSDLPFDFGVLGEIVNFLFAVHTLNNDIENFIPDDKEEYREARLRGKKSGNCHEPYLKCPISALGFISKIHSI